MIVDGNRLLTVLKEGLNPCDNFRQVTINMELSQEEFMIYLVKCFCVVKIDISKLGNSSWLEPAIVIHDELAE